MTGDRTEQAHHLLGRQLRRMGLSPDAAPNDDGWAAFLRRVSVAYTEADDDRYLLERSLEVSSTEMADLYEELRQASESRIADEHARLLAVTEHSPIAIVEIDANGYVLFENPACREITGQSFVGKVASRVAGGELDRPRWLDAAREARERGTDVTLISRFTRPDGNTRWLRSRVRALREEAVGRADRWFIVAADITDEVEARVSTERLTTLLEAATDVVAVFEPDGALLHLNGIGCRYLGVEGEDELVGHNLFELVDARSREQVRGEARAALHTDGVWTGEATLTGPGLLTPMSLVLIAHRDGDGEIEYCAAIGRDVTELKAVQHALEREATHDALTALPNRTLILDRLDQAVLRAERTNGGLAVLYIDLDRVKIVNDRLGHDAGDKLLIQAAERLQHCVRSVDTVGRLGGDEFVVLGEDLDGPQDGVRLALRTVHAFAEPFDLEGAEAFVTASVGVVIRSAGDTAATLLRDADVAMYRAKQAGGGRYELFDSLTRKWVTERFEIESALRHALDRDELDVHYQPQVRPATGELIGFEALARWDRPTIGPVSPEVFIPLAEETGIIGVIGAHVLETACSEAASWNADRSGEEPIRLAVNVSGRQLIQPGLCDLVEHVLDVSGLDPKCLTLEITETVLVKDPSLGRARLEALRDIGVRLALDDFGKGYSSLAYLQGFPLDSVKIDQVFVAGLGHKGIDTTIVASVIDLAHALGFEVVAEGVERPDQLTALVELGCDLAQGHIFAPALSASATKEMLELPHAPDPVLWRPEPALRAAHRPRGASDEAFLTR